MENEPRCPRSGKNNDERGEIGIQLLLHTILVYRANHRGRGFCYVHGIEAVMREKFVRRTRLTELVRYAEPFERNRMVLGKEFGDGAPEAAWKGALLEGKDRAVTPG